MINHSRSDLLVVHALIPPRALVGGSAESRYICDSAQEYHPVAENLLRSGPEVVNNRGLGKQKKKKRVLGSGTLELINPTVYRESDAYLMSPLCLPFSSGERRV